MCYSFFIRTKEYDECDLLLEKFALCIKNYNYKKNNYKDCRKILHEYINQCKFAEFPFKKSLKY